MKKNKMNSIKIKGGLGPKENENKKIARRPAYLTERDYLFEIIIYRFKMSYKIITISVFFFIKKTYFLRFLFLTMNVILLFLVILREIHFILINRLKTCE